MESNNLEARFGIEKSSQAIYFLQILNNYGKVFILKEQRIFNYRNGFPFFREEDQSYLESGSFHTKEECAKFFNQSEYKITAILNKIKNILKEDYPLIGYTISYLGIKF